MNKIVKIVLLIVIAIVVVAVYLMLSPDSVSESDKDSPGMNYDEVDIQIRDMSNVPSEFFSGSSRYSHGECDQDVQCKAIGCNIELCSSDHDMATTCILDDQAPDKEKYDCGCILDTCGWYEK